MGGFIHLPLIVSEDSGTFIKYKKYERQAFLGVVPSKDSKTDFFRIQNEDATLRYFFENIKNHKIDEARAILSRGLLFDDNLDLEDFFQFVKKDSSYKCLLANERPDKNFSLKKKSVLIMTKDMPKTIVHIYMKMEQDGNWKIYGIERE